MIDFLNWWQILPYNFDPVAFDVLGFKIYYYGLSYIVAFLVTYILVIHRIKKESRFCICTEYIQELMLVAMIGVFLGGRIGYAIFYNFGYYVIRPLELFLPVDLSNGFVLVGFRGMSYHGGLIGSLLAVFIFTNSRNINFLKVIDS